LPLVDELLETPQLKALTKKFNRNVVVSRVRAMIGDLTAEVSDAAANRQFPDLAELADRIARRLRSDDRAAPCPVVNATGALWPADLGSPPLADDAVTSVAIAARETVELSNLREATDESLRLLAGCEASAVAASFPAAVLWTLAALSHDAELVIARGHVIETSDGQRLGETARSAGARLREIGAANRTTRDDYARALCEHTGAVLWVDVGRGAPSLREVAEVAHARGVRVVAIVEAATLGDVISTDLAVPSVATLLADGADVVVFPGDRFIGGPSVGFVVGRRRELDRLQSHSLRIALRADASALAGLQATLALSRDSVVAQQSIPVLRLLHTPLENLRLRAEHLVEQIRGSEQIESVVCIERTGAVFSRWTLPTWCVVLRPAEGDATRFASRLRDASPSLAVRVEGEQIVIDLRSVLPRQDQTIVAALTSDHHRI
jgi:L-seryl-tRNA(Ser) seleniumtransferase